MKLKRSTFLLLLIVTVFLAACRRDHVSPHTIVQGTVLEYGSNQPLANKQLIIGRRDGGFGPGNYTTIAVLNSDINGNFNYEFDGVNGDIYVIGMNNISPHNSVEFFSNVPGYPPTSSGSPMSITLGKTNTIKIYLTPPGWLKLRVRNIHHSNMIFLTIPFSVNYYGIVDTTSTFQEQGNTLLNLQWTVVDSLYDTTHFNAAVNIPLFDTLAYQIDY
ncbi:MAG: hypothetical protein ABIQ40_06510 [Bacteroidia bacterium]